MEILALIPGGKTPKTINRPSYSAPPNSHLPPSPTPNSPP